MVRSQGYMVGVLEKSDRQEWCKYNIPTHEIPRKFLKL